MILLPGGERRLRAPWSRLKAHKWPILAALLEEREVVDHQRRIGGSR